MKSPPYSSEFRNESCFTRNPGCILKNEVLHSPKPTLIFKRLKQCIYIYIYIYMCVVYAHAAYVYISMCCKQKHPRKYTNKSFPLPLFRTYPNIWIFWWSFRWLGLSDTIPLVLLSFSVLFPSALPASMRRLETPETSTHWVTKGEWQKIWPT